MTNKVFTSWCSGDHSEVEHGACDGIVSVHPTDDGPTQYWRCDCGRHPWSRLDMTCPGCGANDVTLWYLNRDWSSPAEGDKLWCEDCGSIIDATDMCVAELGHAVSTYRKES